MARPRFALPLPSRLGLRARITLAFTLVAAVLSALLGGTTWGLTRESLINQREASLSRQALLNARYLRDQLPASPSAEQDLVPVAQTALASLDFPSGSRPLLRLVETGEVRWVAEAAQGGEAVLPASLRELVVSGEGGRMRFDLDGEVQLAVGVPIPDRNAAYFEIVSLGDLRDTLEVLAASLTGAGLLTTLAGAGLGYWAARRTLRPLSNVGLAAEAIAGGRLDTRLEGTEDRDLEALVDSFNHMARALEERVDRDARFASDVSHELRSPLMTLAASVQVLAARRDEMPDDAARSAVDLMEADVVRFQNLVDDLLEISRFDAGVARLSLDDVLLSELVRQAVATSSSPEVPVEVEGDVDTLVVRADKRRLVRVIANLLDNARKYGGGATAVNVTRDDGAVRIGIEDNGPGVPIDERDVVFERFARGRTSSSRTGTEGVGLGLSLVAEHVRLHGGSVWVEDRPDGREGARFVVELPVAARS